MQLRTSTLRRLNTRRVFEPLAAPVANARCDVPDDLFTVPDPDRFFVDLLSPVGEVLCAEELRGRYWPHAVSSPGARVWMVNEVPGGACAALLDLWKGDAAYEMRGLWVAETELCAGDDRGAGELAAHEALLLVAAGFADLRHAELRLPPAATHHHHGSCYARPLLALLGFLAAPGAAGGGGALVRPPLASVAASHELLGAVVSQAERAVLLRASRRAGTDPPQ